MEHFGIYDSGSNVSIINSITIHSQQKNYYNKKQVNLITINSVNETDGMLTR